MRISHRWLTELLPGLTLPPDRLAEHLTRLGLLVEEVVRAERGLESVVVARMEAVAPHPRADRLKVCRVRAGGEHTWQIVCGAPVVKEGALYPLALPGAELPGGKTIVASEIRGVRSEGMLCSAPELGLDHLGEAGGILELEGSDAEPGSAAASALHLDDTVYVLEVFSNRPDWESHLGVARELQELAGGRLRVPGERGGASGTNGGSGDRPAPAGGRAADLGEKRLPPVEAVRVRVVDRQGCSFYSGQVLRGVRLAPSPLAVRQRLALLGIRPINNVVDATNWVMLELGTPLHAFDLARIRGGEVRVRRGECHEPLVTLDGKARVLSPEMTVIADVEGAVAIGGVIGGRHSEVTPATRDVFLEAAHFDPARVRRSAAALGLRTEASHRFGRGVDPGMVPVGLRRAAGLLAEWAGAAVEGAPTADRGRERPPAAVELRPQRVKELTGLALPRAELVRALASVDLPVEDAAGALRVHVPGHRYDLECEADLVEEVVRRVGYDRVPVQTLPPRPGVARGSRSARIEGLARRLLALGLDEAYTSTFFDPAPFGRDFFEGRLLQPLNPLAQSERHLRPSLAPTLVLAARRNLRRGARGAALFEIGHVFEAAPEPVDETRVPGVARGDLPRLAGVVERRVLGFALAGARGAAHWSDGGRAREADFFDAKGVVEAVVGPGRELSARPSAEPWLHPGQQAELRLGGERLGFAGRLHPRVERALDLEAPAIVAEMALAPLIEGRDATAFAPLSPFPRVERDVALVVPDSVPAGEVLRRIHGLGLANLTDVRLFDLYRGAPVPPGARSLAFRLVFQSPARTLTDAEVEREMARLVARLEDAGLHLR